MSMKKYQFTGHLSPLPPGVKLPLQLSGEVYLPADVEQEIFAIRERHQQEVTRLHRQITRLRGQLDNQRRKRVATQG